MTCHGRLLASPYLHVTMFAVRSSPQGHPRLPAPTPPVTGGPQGRGRGCCGGTDGGAGAARSFRGDGGAGDSKAPLPPKRCLTSINSIEQLLQQAPFFFLLNYYFGGGNIWLNVFSQCSIFEGAVGLGGVQQGRGAHRRCPRGAPAPRRCCPRPPVTVLLSPSPVSPASLVMLHTSLPLHIATGTLFSTTSRGRPARRAAAKPSAAARSPLPRHGAGGSAPRQDRPEPEPRAPAQGPRLSSPPRSISEMCLEDFFIIFFFLSICLPRGRWLSRGNRNELS